MLAKTLDTSFQKAELQKPDGDKTPFLNFKCELFGNPPILIDGTGVDINGLSSNKRFYLTEKALPRLGKPTGFAFY